MTTTINAPSEAGRATAGGLPGTGLDVAVFITCINDVMFLSLIHISEPTRH